MNPTVPSPLTPLLPVLFNLPHVEKLRIVNLLLQKIAAEESLVLNVLPAAHHSPAFNWEGGLSELNTTYSSVALQKKALEWR
jgi:hypothetical protein